MSVDSNYMEHRWGTRVELDVPAGLRTIDGHLLEAWVKNASVSGAFVATSTPLPLLSRVSLSLLAGIDDELDACVVRIEDNGMALEWLDPGSRMVPALISMRRDSRGGVLQTMPERVFSVQASSRT